MKLAPLILIVLCGCAASPAPARVQPVALRSMTLQSVIEPPPVIAPVTWTWQPGGYTSFAIITSDTLAKSFNYWTTFLVTTNNHFEAVPTLPKQYFAVCGFTEDGWTDWIK